MRTPYKMKGSKFYGKGNSSPAKADMTLQMVEAVKAKDEQDLKFKQKGWVGALQKAESAIRRPVKKAIDDVDTNLEGLEEETPVVEEVVDDNSGVSSRPSFEQSMEDEKGSSKKFSVKERAHNRNYQKGYDEKLGY